MVLMARLADDNMRMGLVKRSRPQEEGLISARRCVTLIFPPRRSEQGA